MMEAEVGDEFLDCCAAGGPQGTWKLEYLLILPDFSTVPGLLFATTSLIFYVV